MKPLKVFLVCLIVILVISTLASAEVPKMINYQGKITRPSGALIDTTTSMVLSIYVDSIGGTPLWTETQNSVKIQDGVFSVLLGNITPIPDSVFDENTRYLGLKVGNDNEMTPRKAIVSVGYAYHSRTADTAEYALTAPSSAGVGIVPVGTIIAWVKSFPNTPPLPDNFIECNGQILNDPASPYNGLSMPNLNTDHRFLRGSVTSGTTGGNETLALQLEKGGGGNSLTTITGCSQYIVTNTCDTGPSRVRINLPNTDYKPPYYEVVWILRIK